MSNEELCQRLQQGDEEALGLLWANNQRFTFMIVRRYAPTPSVGFDDLTQAAFFGLREAALAYDGRWPFLKLLAWRIRKVCREALGLRGRRQIEAASLDAPLNDETGDTLADVLPDDSLPEHGEAIEREELRRAVREAVDALPARESRIVRGHWLEGLMLDDLAQTEGISRERVRQLELNAFGRLRKTLAPYYSAPTSCAPTGFSYWQRHASATEVEALARLQRLECEDQAYCRLLEAQIAAGRLTMETARVFLGSFRESRGWRRDTSKS